QFYEGQWFNGRIYERRCDLSPSGKRLIYFAASYKAPYAIWTAVSRLPFLTAVTLWPKGDGWGRNRPRIACQRCLILTPIGTWKLIAISICPFTASLPLAD